MAFTLDEIQEDILDFLKATVFPNENVVEQEITDVEQVQVNSYGLFTPYIAVQFGDLQPWGSTSMIGPRGDDYILPLYIGCASPQVALSRRLQNQGVDKFLGASFDWAGQIRKRAGGRFYTLTKSDGTGPIYLAPLSFGLVVQLATTP